MWDILAFFRGGINGEGAHDDLGKEIAEAGKAWVDECYRWADLEAYQYRYEHAWKFSSVERLTLIILKG